MEGVTPSRDTVTEMGSFNPVEGGDEEAKKGTSDNPEHREPGFVPVDQIPDGAMNPEEALLAKEEAEQE